MPNITLPSTVFTFGGADVTCIGLFMSHSQLVSCILCDVAVIASHLSGRPFGCSRFSLAIYNTEKQKLCLTGKELISCGHYFVRCFRIHCGEGGGRGLFNSYHTKDDKIKHILSRHLNH